MNLRAWNTAFSSINATKRRKRWPGARSLAITVSLLAFTSGASAATLNVVGGELRGASNVVVGGSLYDVEFLGGTCIALFSGCDDPSDFDFAGIDAFAAAQALLDQVFIDGALGQFDTEPELTAGCGFVDECRAGIPHTLTAPSGVFFAAAQNRSLLPDNAAFSDVTGISTTFGSEGSFATWARFTPVPEPGTALFLGLGLFALGSRPESQRRP